MLERLPFLIAILLAFQTFAYSDTIYFNDGTIMRGVIAEETDESVVLKVSIGNFTIDKTDISSIDRDTMIENREIIAEWDEQRKRLEEQDKQRRKERIRKEIAAELGEAENIKGRSDESVELRFNSPLETFRSYMRACRAMDLESSRACYTKEFQDFTKTSREYSDYNNVRQLKNAYNFWHDKQYDLELHGNMAIMRFAAMFKRPEPIYFVKEDGEWKIDGLFSFKNIVIEDSKHWHWRFPELDNEKLWLGI